MTAKQVQVGTHREAIGCARGAAEVDYAYQPIVSSTSLRVHGFEALARFPGDHDASNVVALLEAAAAQGTIQEVESTLVSEAISKFARFGAAAATTLFCNVDNRLYDENSRIPEEILNVIRTSGLSPSNVCIEISESVPISSTKVLEHLLESLARSNVRVALDDFGIGLSGLQRLLLIEPHYVKIDRSFIDGLAANQRKQAIVSKLCGLAHALGFTTVAEGIEQEQDFRAARELGCDYAQGFLISRPVSHISDLRLTYDSVNLSAKYKGMSPRVAELLSTVEPVQLETPLADAARRFNSVRGLSFLPVVDAEGKVKGALFEEDVRQLLISEFGPALLANRGVETKVEAYVRRCPIGEAHGSVEAIVNSYVVSEGAVGIVLAVEGRYAGYLSNNAVLRLAAERDISEARDQNPLTHLPGNQSVKRQIELALTNSGDVTLALIDFDNFKAFNDCYGFAAGDRSLQMFAGLLHAVQRERGAFVGHVGGDDFFVLLKGPDGECETALSQLCGKFASDAQSLYSPFDRAAGGIRGVDRFGGERFFPMLRASAGVLHLPVSRAHLSPEVVEKELALLKKKAKLSSGGLATWRLPESAPAMMAAQLDRALGAASPNPGRGPN